MYSVSEYLEMLRLARRAPSTLKAYEKSLKSYADFLSIPLDEVHDHLKPQNLIKYAASRQKLGWSEYTVASYLNMIHRFFVVNEVPVKPLELNVIKVKPKASRDDKPLEFETLQKMMDLASVHGKAILSVLVSTGMRRGEAAEILLSDLNGDTIHIRPEIAKRGKGGNVYLTREAQEFVALWLKERDDYIHHANRRAYGAMRPENDQRLFACCQNTMRDVFNRLYEKVDGERGRSRHKITMHSCRRYFRTQAAKTMPLDLVEKILRHSGYLTDSYVRIPEEEAKRLFHEGEHILYITRRDQRLADNKIRVLEDRIQELEKTEELIKRWMDWKEEPDFSQTKKKRKNAVEEGLEDIKAGRVRSLEDVMRDLGDDKLIKSMKI